MTATIPAPGTVDFPSLTIALAMASTSGLFRKDLNLGVRCGQVARIEIAVLVVSLDLRCSQPGSVDGRKRLFQLLPEFGWVRWL